MSSFDDVPLVNVEHFVEEAWSGGSVVCYDSWLCKKHFNGTHALLPHDIYSVLLEVARATISYRKKWSWTGQAKVNRALDRLAAFGDLPEAE